MIIHIQAGGAGRAKLFYFVLTLSLDGELSPLKRRVQTRLPLSQTRCTQTQIHVHIQTQTQHVYTHRRTTHVKCTCSLILAGAQILIFAQPQNHCFSSARHRRSGRRTKLATCSLHLVRKHVYTVLVRTSLVTHAVAQPSLRHAHAHVRSGEGDLCLYANSFHNKNSYSALGGYHYGGGVIEQCKTHRIASVLLLIRSPTQQATAAIC